MSDKEQRYLVIGIYEADNERFAETFTADTPQAAEAMAEEWASEGEPILIAGVLDGEGKVVA